MNIVNDQYNGVIITEYPKTLNEFEKELNSLISSLEDKRLLWIKIQIEDSVLIPHLTNEGFIFHHCNEKDITLLKKLIPNPIIPTAKNHVLGVGAIVFDEDKILVIKDKIWQKYKLPGGHIDDSENISTALVREVYEETGVEVEFDKIVSLGHFIPGQFGESTLYVVCMATALTKEIDIKDTEEIIEARWLKLDEFLEDKEVHPYNKSIVKKALDTKGFLLEEDKNLITRNDIEYELFS